VNSAISFSKYAGVAATAMWTLGWVVAAYVAVEHLNVSRDSAALLSVVVTVAFSALGCGANIRFARRIPSVQQEEKPPAESLSRRIVGWFAEFVWVAVATVWTLAVDGCVVRAAHDGHLVTVLMMIPFSLIGWLLLIVRFVSAGMAIDSLLHRTGIVKGQP
jgi:hypothetical protein